LFAAYCDNNATNSRAIIRFSRGWLVIYNTDDFAVLVLGREDLNKVTLNLVFKSAIKSLTAALQEAEQQAATGQRLSPDQAHALLRAINLSLAFFNGKMSRHEMAELLRKAKAALITRFPSLKHFTIDANGGVILIKGAEKNMDSEAVLAAAGLASRFIELAAVRMNVAGFDLEKQTAEVSPILAKLGFYAAFQRTAGAAAK
jgi:hypothetical protein